MIVELSCLVVGIPIGFVLRRSSRIHKITDTLLTWSVRFLLFLLGLSIGADPAIMDNLDTLGLQAAFIAFCSVLGSILVTGLLEKRMQHSINCVTNKVPLL